MKVTFTYPCISTATIKAYTDGGAGQVCSIVGAEKERYNLYTNVTSAYLNSTQDMIKFHRWCFKSLAP